MSNANVLVNQPQRYRVVRFRGRPIMALPEGPRALSRIAISKFQPSSVKRRLVQQFVKAAFTLGFDRAVTGFTISGADIVSPSFDSWIEEMRVAFKEVDAVVAVVWPPQSDRRRVYVHLFGPKGAPLGFCKVAVGSHDHEIFRMEIESTDAVRNLGLRRAQIPPIIKSGSFADLQYVVFEPFLDGIVPYIGDWSELSLAVMEYSGSPMWLAGHELKEFSWWERFERQRKRCNEAFQVQLDIALNNAARVCRVHGDLIPANLYRQSGKLLICDWEFSCPAGPYGTDELCYRLSLCDPLALSKEPCVAARFVREIGGSCNLGEFVLALAFLVGREFRHAISLAQNWQLLEG
jgi:hypothetical protein